MVRLSVLGYGEYYKLGVTNKISHLLTRERIRKKLYIRGVGRVSDPHDKVLSESVISLPRLVT